jgi:hypothetical protein
MFRKHFNTKTSEISMALIFYLRWCFVIPKSWHTALKTKRLLKCVFLKGAEMLLLFIMKEELHYSHS